MTAAIRNFIATLETVLDLLRQMIFDPMRARVELFFEDLDGWLAARGLTLPQLVGHLFATMFTAMVLGVLVDLVGLAVGTFIGGSEMVARWLIVIGALIFFAGFLPLALLYSLARTLFDLVIRGGEMVMEILSDEDNNEIPDRIRQQLEAMRNHRNLTAILQIAYASFAVATIWFLCWPNFNGLFRSVIAVIAISGVITLRHLNRVKGYGVTKLMMAGAYGFTGGAIVYVALSFIAKPLLNECWPNLVTDQHARQFILIATMLAAAITFLVQLGMRLGDEEDDIRKGDVRIKPYKLKVTAVDASTGRPSAYAISDHASPHSSDSPKGGSLLSSMISVLLAVAVAAVLIAVLLMIGLSSLPMVTKLVTIVIVCVVGVLGIVLFFLPNNSRGGSHAEAH